VDLIVEGMDFLTRLRGFEHAQNCAAADQIFVGLGGPLFVDSMRDVAERDQRHCGSATGFPASAN
jgi:hypothetical protein